MLDKFCGGEAVSRLALSAPPKMGKNNISSRNGNGPFLFGVTGDVRRWWVQSLQNCLLDECSRLKRKIPRPGNVTFSPKLISHTSIGGDNKDVKSIIKYSNFGKSLGWDRNWIGSLKLFWRLAVTVYACAWMWWVYNFMLTQSQWCIPIRNPAMSTNQICPSITRRGPGE